MACVDGGEPAKALSRGLLGGNRVAPLSRTSVGDNQGCEEPQASHDKVHQTPADRMVSAVSFNPTTKPTAAVVPVGST